MKCYISLSLFLYNLLLCQDKSLDFDGINDYVLISDHNQLDLTSNYTIEAWIFPEEFSWLSGIVSKYQSSAANGYLLRLTDQAPYTGLSFDEATTNTGILNANQWYHIAAVKNQNTRKLYINGSEYNLSGTSLNVTSNNNPVRIGSDYSSRFFSGRIDEVRLWNISRTSEEINQFIDQSLTGNEEGLVAYYTFDEGTGDTLFDHSNNSHYGLLRGSPSWVDGHSLSGILGDINFDESINIYDAVMLVSIMLGYEVGSPLQVYASDINQDGSIDIIDVITIIQLVLEINITNRTILTEAEFFKQNNNIYLESNGEILGFEIQLLNESLISYDGLPSNWSWTQRGKKIIGFSLDGSSLPSSFNLKMPLKNEIKQLSLGGWGKNLVKAKQILSPILYKLKSGPNPFNPICNISFSLKSDKNIKAHIYNINGQLTHVLIDEHLKSGSYNYSWKPMNVSSGTYIIRLSDGENILTNKILFLK